MAGRSGIGDRRRITTVPRVSIMRGIRARPPLGGAGVKPYCSAGACWVAKISICSPSARVTTAFFQERVMPDW